MFQRSHAHISNEETRQSYWVCSNDKKKKQMTGAITSQDQAIQGTDKKPEKKDIHCLNHLGWHKGKKPQSATLTDAKKPACGVKWRRAEQS